MPSVVLPSINKKSFHWSACLYASRLFLGTISLHLDLLTPLRAFMPQVGGSTASLEICVILIQRENASCPILCNPLPKVNRLLQAEKAHLPMLLPAFMSTDTRLVYLLKALSPILPFISM